MASERSASHLAPGFLVAAPGLRDPNFAGSLVLMTGHRKAGAMGFVVNRPAQVSIADILSSVDDRLGGLARASEHGAAPGADRGAGLHRSRSGCSTGGGRGARTTTPSGWGGTCSWAAPGPSWRPSSRPTDPVPVQLFVGYAGWAPMQLEEEISHGSWVPLGFEEDLVTTVPVPDRWSEAVRRLGLDPNGFLVGGGGAMA